MGQVNSLTAVKQPNQCYKRPKINQTSKNLYCLWKTLITTIYIKLIFIYLHTCVALDSSAITEAVPGAWWLTS